MPTAPKKEKWAKSKAKQLLKVDILLGNITEDTDLEALHQSLDEYKKWPWAQFKRNTSSLIKACNDPTRRPKIKWAGSDGRELLKQDIIAGHVHELSDPEQVYNSRDEFKLFKLSNFRTNLANLLEQIISEFERLEVDSEAYGHDLAIILEMRANNPQQKRPWHRSPCKELLEKDIDDKKHLAIDPMTNKKVTPKQLYQSRIEYREYTLKVFRNHIYQEIDKRAKKLYRQEKKKKRCRPPPDVQTATNKPVRRVKQTSTRG